MSVRSYRDLEVYQESFRLAVRVDEVSKELPRHEMFEVGSQVRRSAKSIPANLAEGYGRRRYKQDFVRFVVYALASCDETLVHLDLLCETGSLAQDTYRELRDGFDVLSKRINRFLQGIIEHHQEPYR